ncbi:hypothetical protein ACFQLX_15530 [Streptomyces polyrhachis]|uniref:Uncharacterized protein n=1 Tax=Streptomyces polyrhachis TaxID=1282885 RepID=A0ABW2GJ50_9ACTN
MSEETTQQPAPSRGPQSPAVPVGPGGPGRRPVPTPSEVFPPGHRRDHRPPADHTLTEARTA